MNILSRSHARSIIVTTLALSMVAGLLAGAVPLWLQPGKEISFYVSVACTLVFVVLYIGASLLFLVSLSTFKARLKLAYGIMSAGFILLALGQAMILLGTSLDLWSQTWYQIALTVIYFSSTAFIYGGVRIFARTLDIRNPTTSFMAAIIGLMVLVGASIAFLPGIRSDWAVRTGVFQGIWMVGFTSLAAAVAWQIKRRASQTYTQSMNWLVLALGSSAIIYLELSGKKILFPSAPWGIIDAIFLVLFVVNGLILLRAAHLFSELGGRPVVLPPGMKEVKNSVDIIILAASLASSRGALESILDGLRVITASQPLDRPLTPAEQSKLCNVYLGVEEYLVTKDPVRKYDRDTLRSFIREALAQQSAEQATFWPSL